MKVIIRLSRREEARALPILLRHSPGMVLEDRTYVISAAAARSLTEAGVRFTEVSREADAPGLEGAASGERVLGVTQLPSAEWGKGCFCVVRPGQAPPTPPHDHPNRTESGTTPGQLRNS